MVFGKKKEKRAKVTPVTYIDTEGFLESDLSLVPNISTISIGLSS